MLKVVSANRLVDGAVVFLGPQNRWVELLPEAEVFNGEAAISAALARAKTAEAENLVLDSDAIEVEHHVEDGGSFLRRERGGDVVEPRLLAGGVCGRVSDESPENR